eukprot:s283_g10.t4
MGTEQPKGMTGHAKKTTFAFKVANNLSSAVDRQKGPVPSSHGRELAGLLKTAGWRLLHSESQPELPPTEEDMIPRNMRQPRIAPAWMKHDKQVLRFYGFFQETVTERPDENSRVRQVSIMFHMEDGTLAMNEPKVENSGIAQGSFLKRQKVMREDGMAFIGPDDLKVGEQVSINGRVIQISACDRFTRWFYEQNGIELAPDEEMIKDKWQEKYKLRKLTEQGGLPTSKAAFNAKQLAKFQIGAPPADMKFSQFLLNDRKVLRFKAFWDDTTPYGARIYFIIHYFLADNTVEINEAHCRNSGRDAYPIPWCVPKLLTTSQEKMAATLDAKTAGLMQYMKYPPSALPASASTFDCLGLDAGAFQANSKKLAQRRLPPKAAGSVASQVLFDALALDSATVQSSKVTAPRKKASNKMSSSLSNGSTSDGSDESASDKRPLFFRACKPDSRRLQAMTFGVLPPPTVLKTGLNVHSFLDLCEDLDTGSAGNLARMLLPKLQQLEVEHEELLRLALVQSYLQTLRRACEVVSTQCPPTALDVYHLATIESIAGGLLDRVKLRMWFLRADHLLQNWNSVQSESITPDVWRR